MFNTRKIKINKIYIATNMLGRPIFVCSSKNNFNNKIVDYEKQKGYFDLNLWFALDGHPENIKPIYRDQFLGDYTK